jgi:hypothetical protein
MDRWCGAHVRVLRGEAADYKARVGPVSVVRGRQAQSQDGEHGNAEVGRDRGRVAPGGGVGDGVLAGFIKVADAMLDQGIV